MSRSKSKVTHAEAEFNFYIVLTSRLSAEQAQAVRDNLRDFSVKVVESRDETGLSGTALVMGSADSEWFKANRPNLTVVELSGNSIQALTSLYGLFGRTLPPILQEGDRLEVSPIAIDAPVVEPEVLGAGELSQLDERLREVAESLAAIGTSVKTLEGQVGTMNKALFQGNGHPSLMTRVEVLELGQTSFAKQCSDCRAIVLTGSKSKDAEERRTLIVVERWKAITAIITAALASPVIIAVLAALLK